MLLVRLSTGNTKSVPLARPLAGSKRRTVTLNFLRSDGVFAICMTPCARA